MNQPASESQRAADEQTTLRIVEDQIREGFGRVVYSHKTQEKSADRLALVEGWTKIAQITLSGITTGGLVAVLFGDPTTAVGPARLAAVCSTLLLILNLYIKDRDPGRRSQQHKEAAGELWGLRESYLSLLVDLRSGVLTHEEIRRRRDELQEALAATYAKAPRTTSRAYRMASAGLREREELTFNDKELDQFLPAALHRELPGNKRTAA